MTHLHNSFSLAIKDAEDRMFYESHIIHTERWQGVDISKRPEAAMHEVLFHSFQVPIITADLNYHRNDIQPNLPWADDHFEQERVSGEPLNPGNTWRFWPFGHSAAGHLNPNGQFNHTYAERYWPKWAGKFAGGLINADDRRLMEYQDASPHRGIRHHYGDLAGVVRTLVKEPLTRQAYLPVWFPEDTGDAHDGRKPCTLGYHFIMRSGRLHCAYFIRSCDIVRHFRDDIYLTVRLVLWVLDECRKQNKLWLRVSPGDLVMHIGSLHCFRNDYIALQNRYAMQEEV